MSEGFFLSYLKEVYPMDGDETDKCNNDFYLSSRKTIFMGIYIGYTFDALK